MHTLQVTLHLSGQVRFVTFYSGAQPAHVSLAHIVHMHMQMCTYFFGAQCAQLHTLLVIFRFTFIAAGENKISDLFQSQVANVHPDTENGSNLHVGPVVGDRA